jgi:hypothetical protein
METLEWIDSEKADRRKARGKGAPETFNFLGFTHVCGRTRRTHR